MHAAEYLDALTSQPGDPRDEFQRLAAMTGDEQLELRNEVLRRLAAGTVAPELAIAVLPFIGVEPAVPDLVRLLRSAEAPLPVRAAALILLGLTTFDLPRELLKMDPSSLTEVVEQSVLMQASADAASQRGTPFERLALADPDDEETDIDEIVDELIEAFCASPEAAAVEDAEELRYWAGELVRLGVAYGHGSPVVWSEGTINELLTELLPRKVTLGSAAEAEPAVPAFRTFFRWASRVARVGDADEIDEELANLEADFPAMMMDERRFGLAKSFVAQGTAAGFDMTTEEGLIAFQAQWNREHATVTAKSRKKLDAAKKRKAKMAKLSRRKNRRK